ncbi:MAG: triose-phosphate isomerase [Saprospiraceae bacterium]|nr:triose-phosphate isomerase [Saprospiraceae bacterium]
MQIRTKIIAGNWKMYKTVREALNWVDGFVDIMHQSSNAEIALFAPSTSLHCLANRLSTTRIHLGAQNLHEAEWGPYTGEISGHMLQDVGAEWVLIGHSERRQHAFESNDLLRRKIKTAFTCNLKPIYCIGETHQERLAGDHYNRIATQLDEALQDCSEKEILSLIIAYEPVWAIGTGETATVDDAASMHQFVRAHMAKMYSTPIAESIPILYGGSVKPNNAAELFSCPDIDGGLIGGASLDYTSFAAIVSAI